MAATEAPAAALSNQLRFIQIRDQRTSHMAHGDGCQWCQAISMVPFYKVEGAGCKLKVILEKRYLFKI